VTDEALNAANQWQKAFGEMVDAILERNDALVLPTVDHLAHTQQPTPAEAAYWGELRWTAPFNLTGHPAITIPIPQAIPVGLQLIGHRSGDHALVDIAEDVEAALGS
jgi:Asp-tRNA(Asn)/Glu-tRNA(Gln) amidotransferase A subunit family amidase